MSSYSKCLIIVYWVVKWVNEIQKRRGWRRQGDNSLLTLWAGRFRYISLYHPYSSPVRQISLFSIVWRRDEATCPITQLKKQSLFFQWPQKDDQSSWWKSIHWQSTIVGPLRNRLRSQASQSRAGILNLWAPDQLPHNNRATQQMNDGWASEASSVPLPIATPHLLPLLLSQCSRYRRCI